MYCVCTCWDSVQSLTLDIRKTCNFVTFYKFCPTLACTIRLDRAKGVGLKAILVLVGGTGEDILGLGLSMEERREAPLPNDDDNNNKRDSAALRCAFAR